MSSFQSLYQDLVRYLARRTGSADRAADIAQDTYLRLASLEAELAEIENHRAYIYRVAGNLAIDAIRRDGRQAAWISGGGPDENIVDPAPSQEQVAIARDRLRRVEEALETLPQKVRLALLMFKVDGLSHAEIATRLKVSESMVAKYIGQALRHCRDQHWAAD